MISIVFHAVRDTEVSLPIISLLFFHNITRRNADGGDLESGAILELPQIAHGLTAMVVRHQHVCQISSPDPFDLLLEDDGAAPAALDSPLLAATSESPLPTRAT